MCIVAPFPCDRQRTVTRAPRTLSGREPLHLPQQETVMTPQPLHRTITRTKQLALSGMCALVLTLPLMSSPVAAQDPEQPRVTEPPPQDPPRIAALKQSVVAEVEQRAKMVQEIVDMVFSFGELGYQEVETSRYLTGLLEREGFTVQRGISDMPTAWVAKWGSGSPVIALGSDIDGIPKASQKPGVAYREPIVEGAPGHGEGHNSGQAVNIVAALAMKEIMERDGMQGTIMLWPGTAEELVGAKAYFVRDGLFENVDAVLFSHVSSNLSVSWGSQRANGLISVEYTFNGQAAHSAGSPWRGRSALDAVELMNVGWNFRREHLRYQQRSHYIISNGGDQPNVVPSVASVWYYFRETDYPGMMNMWAIGDSIARGAAMMTGTELQPPRILGTAWPQHFSKPIATAMHANIQRVGLPEWSEDDQRFARAVQEEAGGTPRGLAQNIGPLSDPIPESQKTGGGSDDIGDVSWVVPTVTLRYPANIPGLPGHSWYDAIAMATPIAHKGSLQGAKVQAMMLVDLFANPQLVQDAKRYFNEVQTANMKYTPVLRPTDKPATELNENVMARYRELMRPFYYDPAKYRTYLEQLGVVYPQVR